MNRMEEGEGECFNIAKTLVCTCVMSEDGTCAMIISLLVLRSFHSSVSL